MDSKFDIKEPVQGQSKFSEKLTRLEKKDILDTNLKAQNLSNEAKKSERGWIGKFWGASEHSSNNIAGMLIVILLIIGTLYTTYMLFFNAVETHKQVLDFWKIITPLITLALGYVFGHKV